MTSMRRDENGREFWDIWEKDSRRMTKVWDLAKVAEEIRARREIPTFEPVPDLTPAERTALLDQCREILARPMVDQ